MKFKLLEKINEHLTVNQSPDGYRDWFKPIACPDYYREEQQKPIQIVSVFPKELIISSQPTRNAQSRFVTFKTVNQFITFKETMFWNLLVWSYFELHHHRKYTILHHLPVANFRSNG